MKAAAFAGSFDPFTRAHRKLVEQALTVFDRVHVLVADNPDKKYTFTPKERLEIATLSLKGLEAGAVLLPPGLYVGETAKQLGCSALVRGIRDAKDLAYEAEIEYVNRSSFGLETVFFLAQSAMSSTHTRKALQEWVDDANGRPSSIHYATSAAQNYIEAWGQRRIAAMPRRPAR